MMVGRYLVEEEGIMTTKVARYRAWSNNSWEQMADINYFDDETKPHRLCRFTDIIKRKGSSGEYYDYYFLVSVGLEGERVVSVTWKPNQRPAMPIPIGQFYSKSVLDARL